MNKKISVLITLYNHEKYIEKAVKSALNQTLSPFEIIVIDDASTDDSVNAAKKIAHQTVSLYKQQFNLGGPTTMKGLAYCKGNYIAILNSDDFWDEDKLRVQALYLDEHPSCGVVFSRVALIDEQGIQWPANKLKIEKTFSNQNRTRNEWLNYFFRNGNAFCASSALVRREVFERLGLLNGKYIQLQDLEMWFRAAASGYDLHVIDEKLTYYRVYRDSRNMSSYSHDNHSIYTFEFSRLLQSLWEVNTLEQLHQIFPEIEVSSDADDSLVLYYLARYAEQMPTVHHRLFAAETMMEWGGNEHAMYMSQLCHSFGHKEYASFIAGSPIRGLLNSGIIGKCKYMIKKSIMRH